MLYNATLAGNAPVAEYTLSSEEMDDLADSYIAKESKKVHLLHKRRLFNKTT